MKPTLRATAAAVRLAKAVAIAVDGMVDVAASVAPGPLMPLPASQCFANHPTTNCLLQLFPTWIRHVPSLILSARSARAAAVVDATAAIATSAEIVPRQIVPPLLLPTSRWLNP